MIQGFLHFVWLGGLPPFDVWLNLREWAYKCSQIPKTSPDFIQPILWVSQASLSKIIDVIQKQNDPNQNKNFRPKFRAYQPAIRQDAPQIHLFTAEHDYTIELIMPFGRKVSFASKYYFLGQFNTQIPIICWEDCIPEFIACFTDQNDAPIFNHFINVLDQDRKIHFLKNTFIRSQTEPNFYKISKARMENFCNAIKEETKSSQGGLCPLASEMLRVLLLAAFGGIYADTPGFSTQEEMSVFNINKKIMDMYADTRPLVPELSLYAPMESFFILVDNQQSVSVFLLLSVIYKYSEYFVTPDAGIQKRTLEFSQALERGEIHIAKSYVDARKEISDYITKSSQNPNTYLTNTSPQKLLEKFQYSLMLAIVNETSINSSGFLYFCEAVGVYLLSVGATYYNITHEYKDNFYRFFTKSRFKGRYPISNIPGWKSLVYTGDELEDYGRDAYAYFTPSLSHARLLIEATSFIQKKFRESKRYSKYQERKRQESLTDRADILSDALRETLPQTVWQPDEQVSLCNNCQKKFSLILRKHHCRLCGRIFCSNCINDHKINQIYGYGQQFLIFRKEDKKQIWNNEFQDQNQKVPVCTQCKPSRI